MPARMMMGQMAQVKFDAREGMAEMVVDMCEVYTLANRIS